MRKIEMSNILIEVKPDFFKSRLNIILMLIIFVLCILWIGDGLSGFFFRMTILSIIFLLCVYLYDKNTILIIDEEKSIYKTGLLSKKTNEVKHIDVRNIQVFQRVFERVFGIGSVSISSSGQSDIEMKINGIEEYEKVKELINLQRNKLEDSKQTVGSGDDITTQIKKLSELCKEGILTKDEFEQKKKDLLSKL